MQNSIKKYSLTPASRMTRAVAAAAVGLLAAAAGAADISWVGYQAGPPSIYRTSASWFHGDQWFNYHVPGPVDTAIFDNLFDPQGNGMPREVYFGNYVVGASPPSIPSSFTVGGGDADVDRLVVREGDFEFRFTDSSGAPQGSLSAASLIIVGQGAPGGTRDVAASLTIRDGVLRQSSDGNWAGLVVADGWRSTSSLVADGPGARIEVTKDLWIGNGGGTGVLEARDGGVITARGIGMGFYGGPNNERPTAHLLATGFGSFIGTCGGVGNGTLTVQDGANVSSARQDGLHTFAFVGVGDNDVGVATVEGDGSAWTGIDRLTIGGVYHTDTSGHGELDVRNGGWVESSWLVVGNRSRSSGEVRVDGEYSAILTTIGLFGDDGHGVVEVINGGRLFTSQAHIGHTENGRGTMRISDAGSALNSEWLFVAAISPSAEGLLTVNGGAEVTVSEVLAVGPKGQIDVSEGGRIFVGSPPPAPRLGESPDSGTFISDGGRLKGSGIVRGPVSVFGGSLLPGLPIGALTIEGNLRVASGSSLVIDIAGTEPGQFDQLLVTGSASIGGALTLRFLDGYSPESTATFDIVSAGGEWSGVFESVTVEGIEPSRVLVMPGAAGLRIAVAPPGACIGDANGDRSINFDDITAVLASFGATTVPFGAGDANGDGVVNLEDITAVLASYGQACE